MANFSKECHSVERGRPAPVHVKWFRIGLEGIIIAKAEIVLYI